MRSQISTIIHSLLAHDELEAEHQCLSLDWIASGADLFRIEKPATPEMHLVSYCIKIDPIHQKILLTEHRKSGLWLPTGGHIELNEHPKEAALREIHEELSGHHQLLKEDPVFLSVTKTVGDITPHTDVSLWYILKAIKMKISLLTP
jgi:8-oxo-dGTP diphosphatase